MSILSEYIHRTFGDVTKQESVQQILALWAREKAPAVLGLVQQVVTMLETADLPGATKKDIAVKVIDGLIKRFLKVDLPDAVIGMAIEWILVLLRNKDPKPVAPAQSEQDVTTREYATLHEATAIAIIDSDKGYGVFRTAAGKFRVWPTGIGPVPGIQVYPV